MREHSLNDIVGHAQALRLSAKAPHITTEYHTESRKTQHCTVPRGLVLAIP